MTDPSWELIKSSEKAWNEEICLPVDKVFSKFRLPKNFPILWPIGILGIQSKKTYPRAVMVTPFGLTYFSLLLAILAPALWLSRPILMCRPCWSLSLLFKECTTLCSISASLVSAFAWFSCLPLSKASFATGQSIALSTLPFCWAFCASRWGSQELNWMISWMIQVNTV